MVVKGGLDQSKGIKYDLINSTDLLSDINALLSTAKGNLIKY